MHKDEDVNGCRYAVCFDGARDNYEVAVALAEVDMLELLLTDAYLGSSLLRPFARSLTRASVPRYREDLPSALVRSFPAALLAKRSRAASRILGSAQDLLASRFATIARQRPVNLFAYAGYARRAFDTSDRSRRKILFQYHPHRTYEREFLEAAGTKPPLFRKDPDDLGNIHELNSADAIVCASSFTRRSVERVLERKTPIIVAPYGSNIAIPLSAVLERRQVLRASRSAGFKALFVGSGVPRKGIGLLLNAWRAAASTKDRLTLVVRGVDQEVARLISDFGDSVAIRSNLQRKDLVDEYLAADAFVFPSLSEGFAHVVPEALSLGCYTIASDATCLADVAVPSGVGRVVPAGQLRPLIEALDEARALWAAGEIDVAAVGSLGRSFHWETFRELIRTACLAGTVSGH